MDLIGDDRRGRVGAHAARVRSAIAVVAALVILRSRERQDVLAADDRDEARFLAAEKLFDHDRAAGGAELT